MIYVPSAVSRIPIIIKFGNLFLKNSLWEIISWSTENQMQGLVYIIECLLRKFTYRLKKCIVLLLKTVEFILKFHLVRKFRNFWFIFETIFFFLFHKMFLEIDLMQRIINLILNIFYVLYIKIFNNEIVFFNVKLFTHRML